MGVTTRLRQTDSRAQLVRSQLQAMQQREELVEAEQADTAKAERSAKGGKG